MLNKLKSLILRLRFSLYRKLNAGQPGCHEILIKFLAIESFIQTYGIKMENNPDFPSFDAKESCNLIVKFDDSNYEFSFFQSSETSKTLAFHIIDPRTNKPIDIYITQKIKSDYRSIIFSDNFIEFPLSLLDFFNQQLRILEKSTDQLKIRKLLKLNLNHA